MSEFVVLLRKSLLSRARFPSISNPILKLFGWEWALARVWERLIEVFLNPNICSYFATTIYSHCLRNLSLIYIYILSIYLADI